MGKSVCSSALSPAAFCLRPCDPHHDRRRGAAFGGERIDAMVVLVARAWVLSEPARHRDHRFARGKLTKRPTKSKRTTLALYWAPGTPSQNLGFTSRQRRQLPFFTAHRSQQSSQAVHPCPDGRSVLASCECPRPGVEDTEPLPGKINVDVVLCHAEGLSMSYCSCGTCHCSGGSTN